MRLNRLLKYFNWFIGAVLAIFLFVVYWFAYRVLPKTTGEVQAPVSAALTITRDELGTPHIRAATVEDALFAQGYVHAQDRLWQMDALRRLAAGELSEVIGPATLAADEESRRLRMRRIAEQEYARLPAQDRSAVASYARGVNFFLETHQNALPVEFTLLGYQPRPWSGVDTLLAGLQMYRDLTSTWKDEVAKASMLQRGDRAKVDYLLFPRSGTEFSPGAVDYPGSNAWAVNGEWTESGKPLLANDPHLSWGIPSPWYLNHLEAPGLNVAGTSLPGLPCVIVGHNDRIAWGITNLHYDVQDLYIERINRQTGQYLFRGQTLQAHAEKELIRVKGGKPIEFTNWVTHHGPLWSTTGDTALSLRWSAAVPGMVQIPFLQINTARNWDEFLAGLKRFTGPGSNFVYADADGNVGYKAAGGLPIREHLGDVPVDGASGGFEWKGFIPFEELPSAFNPPNGLIVSANQNPFPPDYPYKVNGNFAPPNRSKQILSLLRSRRKWKPEEMLAVQKDVYSALSHFLAGQFVAAYERRGGKHAELQPAVAVLKNWNGQMEKDSNAAFIVTLGYENLRRMVGERAAGQAGGEYDFRMAPSVVERLLRERPAGWFPDYDETLLRALTDGVEEGRRQQGRNLDTWKYGAYLQLSFNHPVITQVPYLGAYFNIQNVPMSGSGTTVKQTTQRLGPSMRFIADTAEWDRSLANLAFGESGQILSWHYKDQWDEYYVGKSFPLPFRSVQGHTLRLMPAKP